MAVLVVNEIDTKLMTVLVVNEVRYQADGCASC